MKEAKEESRRWRPEDRARAYAELEHPADLFLEIRGPDLAALFENALFALYDQLADLEGFSDRQHRSLRVTASSYAEALRALLAEALYLFATGDFVATSATVTLRNSDNEAVEVTADLWGETIDRSRHTLLTEIKAVTYHRLTVEELPSDGWRATVLFDV